MLDVGLGELFCFTIIALLVLGPEKLPVAARFAARWYARIKRHISTIQSEIDRELNLSEFRKEIQEELIRLQMLEQKIQERLQDFDRNSRVTPHTSKPIQQPPIYIHNTEKTFIVPFTNITKEQSLCFVSSRNDSSDMNSGLNAHI